MSTAPQAEQLCVKNVSTGKKYKVTVRRTSGDPSSTADDEWGVSDVSVLTLKKNFSPIVKSNVKDMSLRWVRVKTPHDAIGELLLDHEYAPLGGTILICVDHAQDDDSASRTLEEKDQRSSSIDGNAVWGAPKQPTYHAQSSATTPSPSVSPPQLNEEAAPPPAFRGRPPVPVAKEAPTSRVVTPKRQELLDLAHHIFHADSELSYQSSPPPPVEAMQPPLVQKTPQRRKSDDNDDVGKEVESRTAKKSYASSSSYPREDSGPASGQSYDSRADASWMAWKQRCADLEEEKRRLAAELMSVRQELSHARSSTARTSVSQPPSSSARGSSVSQPRYFDPALDDEPRLDEHHAKRSLSRDSVAGPRRESLQVDEEVLAGLLSRIQPSQKLTDALESVRHRRQRQAEMRQRKEAEWAAERQRLNAAQNASRTSLLVDLKQRLDHVQRAITTALDEQQRRRQVVEALQAKLQKSDALADAEKARVDEATRILDDAKESLLRLLRTHTPAAPSAQADIELKDRELAQFIASTAAQKQKHIGALNSRRRSNEILRNEYEDLLQARKDLHNQVEDAKGNIRVVVRMRPKVPADATQPYHAGHLEDGALEVDESRHAVFLSTPTTGTKRHEFYAVYGPSHDSLHQQGVLFEEQVLPLLHSVFDGVNVAVLAYGPTGSGKTFSILGKTDDGQLSGLLPQSVEYLLDSIPRDSSAAGPPNGKDFTPGVDPMRQVSPGKAMLLHRLVSCSMTMVEVYMDQVFDVMGLAVLNGSSTGPQTMQRVDVRHGSDSVSMSGATEVELVDWEQAMQLIQQGLKLRKTHKTLKNFESSRSHLIVTMHVCTRKITAEEQQLETSGMYHHSSFSSSSSPVSSRLATHSTVQRSKLVFVDLAGSERVSRSLSQGDRLKEAQHINKSLSALGDVVHALSCTPRPHHVPYRNSRLTQLLFDAVGGNAKTLLLTCICPHIPQLHNLVETQSTLQFASRAKMVRNALQVGNGKFLFPTDGDGDHDASGEDASHQHKGAASKHAIRRMFL